MAGQLPCSKMERMVGNKRRQKASFLFLGIFLLGRRLVYFWYMKEFPISRFDAAPAQEAVEERSSEQEFSGWLHSETDIGINVFTPHELFYLHRLYDSADAQKRESIAKFILHYELDGASALVATEYHPEVGELLIQSFLSEKASTGGGYYDLENSEKGTELRSAISRFGLVFHAVEDTTDLIEDESLRAQMFEAFSRKGADLMKVFVMSMEKNSEGEKVGEFTTAECCNALDAYAKVLDLLRNFFYEGLREGGAYAFDKEEEKKGQYPKYHIRNRINGMEYGMKWFIRPRAGSDGQARVSVEIDFDTENPDSVLREFFKQKTERLKDGEVIRVEEGSSFRMSIDRDTTDPESPAVSLDICRAAYQGKTFNRTGDKLGNMLALATEEGSHTPYSFDPKFADEEEFASIASRFAEYISDPQPTESQTAHQM